MKNFIIHFLLVQYTFAFYNSNLDDVVQLTKSNIYGFLESVNKPAVIEFYTTWCGHSKKLATRFKDKYIVGAVDCDSEEDICDFFKIRGYPTIKVFDGKKFLYYDGNRTADEIANFVENLEAFQRK